MIARNSSEPERMSETSGHKATDDLNGPVYAHVHDILEIIKLQKGQTDSNCNF